MTLFFLHARKLKGLQNFRGVQIRPALTPLQRQLKRPLDDYRWGTFQKDSAGRFPVAVRYFHDGTPYLWHFGRKEKIAPPLTSRPRTGSDAGMRAYDGGRLTIEASTNSSVGLTITDGEPFRKIPQDVFRSLFVTFTMGRHTCGILAARRRSRRR